MKGYKFKLEALLKIRKIKEDKCKHEIGRMQIELANLKQQIVDHDQGIELAYSDQEQSMQRGMEGREASFYPYFIQNKRENIKQLEQMVESVQDAIAKKFKELAQLRADVKVIEKMKEKDFEKAKKVYQKKQDQKVEELVRMWGHTND